MEIKKVNIKDKEKLNRLIQLYIHDLTIYFPTDINNDTFLYDYKLDKYFDDNYAYFIYENNNIRGFILVDDNKDNNYEISEIFVLNMYKHNHIASKAVKKVFDIYKGNWTVKVVPNSKGAEAFWINTVKEYTNNNYELKYTGKYNRPELYFSN